MPFPPQCAQAHRKAATGNVGDVSSPALVAALSVSAMQAESELELLQLQSALGECLYLWHEGGEVR